jgi:drug/metabolite transporter (DMT)-like permease
MFASYSAIMAALLAALLFGASTPFAKLLLGNLSPALLAALLYLGSGVGLWSLRLLRRKRTPHLTAWEWRGFLGAVVSGGVIAPLLLLYGLTRTSASSASLLLNLEAVLTTTIAWIVFKEATDRRLALGMLLIVVGGVVLTWPSATGNSGLTGTALIAAACLCWAIDNNLTRRVAGADADFIAGTKGLIAGFTNLTLCVALGLSRPLPFLVGAAMLVGLIGYGVSLIIFVIALRGLGSARAGAYYSTAPLFGALIAILTLRESASPSFLVSAAFMCAGVALHLTEKHDHAHVHSSLDHSHPHLHDIHHQHEHAFEWNGVEPHVHPHRHAEQVHAHPHFPDLHHRHHH